MNYCENCGYEMPGDANFCKNCGRGKDAAPVAEALYPPPPPAGWTGNSYAPVPAQPYYQAMPQTHPYQKIGGWLRFFQVMMIISLSLYGLLIPINLLQVMIDSMTWAEFAKDTFTNLLSALMMFPTIQLLSRKPSFLMMYHVFFLINLVSFPLQLIFLHNYSDLDGLTQVFTWVFAIIFSVGGFIIYRLYYTRSVRVRTYMGTDEYITKCPFTRGVTPPVPAVPDAEEASCNY